MASNKIAIIIPAYNEASSICRVINELNKVLDNVAEIVVVNDCSTDKTSKNAKSTGVHVVDLAINHGYSRAIEQGFSFACQNLEAKYLITMDADGQHDPQSVKQVVKLIQTDCFDIVIGTRDRCARFSERLYATYYKFKFGINDPLCGLKAYRASIYMKYGRFETFDSIGTELLAWSLLNTFKIQQTRINIREREDESRFGSLFSANKRIFLSLIKSYKYINKGHK